MLGGGEEYFQPPPPFAPAVLKDFAVFCNKLRRAKKPSGSTVKELITMAETLAESACSVDDNHSSLDKTAPASGASLAGYELVLGAIFRHIKTWRGKKCLTYWFLLDHLVKQHPATFRFLSHQHILDLVREHIPWEDAELCPKFQSLIDHWDNVFPSDVVLQMKRSKREKLETLGGPDGGVERLRKIQADEEAMWEATEAQYTDEGKLNDHGMPCHEYLLGRCQWGDDCPQLHPPGLEGSLPSGSRVGDWKCVSCGTINRHFRRRCQSCVKEKPQYRRALQVSVEEQLLTNPDGYLKNQLFSAQFGYDPLDEKAAVEFWRNRLAGQNVKSHWEEQRRAAYKTRILGKEPQTALETKALSTTHFGPNGVLSGGGRVSLRRVGGSGDTAKEALVVSVTKNNNKRKRNDDEENTQNNDTDNIEEEEEYLPLVAPELPSHRKRLELLRGGAPQAANNNGKGGSASGAAPAGFNLPALPPMPAKDLVFHIAQTILDKGIFDKDFNGYAFLLSQNLTKSISGNELNTPTPLMVVLINALKLIYSSWSKTKSVRHVCVPLMSEIKSIVMKIPFSNDGQKEEVAKMVAEVLSQSQ